MHSRTHRARRLPHPLHLESVAPRPHGNCPRLHLPHEDAEGQRGRCLCCGWGGPEASRCSLASGLRGWALSPVGQGLALTCSACCVAVDWSPCRPGQFQHLAMGGLDSPGRLSLIRRRIDSFIWLLFICLARRPWHIVGARSTQMRAQCPAIAVQPERWLTAQLLWARWSGSCMTPSFFGLGCI